METIIIETHRDSYSIGSVVNEGLTVGKLIELLSNYEEEQKIVLSFDNGYTYGSINLCDIREQEESEE